MNLFVLFMGWRGCFMVVAQSRGEALRLILDQGAAEYYEKPIKQEDLKVYPVGEVVRCWGDE